jgi:hypothetical protein
VIAAFDLGCHNGKWRHDSRSMSRRAESSILGGAKHQSRFLRGLDRWWREFQRRASITRHDRNHNRGVWTIRSCLFLYWPG